MNEHNHHARSTLYDSLRYRTFLKVGVLVMSFTITPLQAASARDTATGADVRRSVASQAAATSGVPLTVLLAISLTETGRNRNGNFEPWPWTVNMEGKGIWFDTRAAAYEYVIANYQRGARSFDIGCFQINYKWHGKAFSSIEAMFDPATNAAYAARHLLELYAEKGNWQDAAGAYHSRTPKFADKYKARFQRIRAGLGDADAIPPLKLVQAEQSTLESRVNTYPLLQAGKDTAALKGSLVRLASKTGTSSLITSGRGPLF